MKILIGGVVGALAGWGLFLLARCSFGTCPLTSDPGITVTVLAVAGAGAAAIIYGKK